MWFGRLGCVGAPWPSFWQDQDSLTSVTTFLYCPWAGLVDHSLLCPYFSMPLLRNPTCHQYEFFPKYFFYIPYLLYILLTPVILCLQVRLSLNNLNPLGWQNSKKKFFSFGTCVLQTWMLSFGITSVCSHDSSAVACVLLVLSVADYNWRSGYRVTFRGNEIQLSLQWTFTVSEFGILFVVFILIRLSWKMWHFVRLPKWKISPANKSYGAD